MRKGRAPFKSFKSLVSLKGQTTNLNPNLSFGETVIPIGSDNIEVGLPKLQNTYTYNIVNTDRMSGNITLKTTEGASMVGLMLNSSGGGISIDPIVSPTSEMTLENDIKDGCFIQTLSNGNNWYVWSVATGGGINLKTNGINVNYPPTIVLPTPADITNVVITSDVRFNSALEARHDLTFSGEGEPGADLTITEGGGAINPITIKIPSTGRWSVTRATDLPNATYTFDFSPTSGNGVQNKSFIGDTGPITFTVPSAFSPDPGESVNFAAGASATKPDGTSLTVNVDSSAWNSSLAHGDTFNIIYSITDASVNGGVTVSQTVAGTIVDDTPPAAPVILAASIANMNQLSANGTAEPGKTITLFQDNLPLSPTVTSDASTGAWSIGPIALGLNSNFTLKAQASEPGVGNPNRSAFGEYSPAFNYIQPQVQKPTLTIDGETKSTWSNSGPKTYTLRGTTEAGSAIAITADGQAASLSSGPTVVGTDWTATLTVADESQTNFKATATLANHLPNESDPYGLLIDRVGPTITLTGGAQTVGLPNVGPSNDLGFSVSDTSSGVATQTSNWDTQVSTTTEGTYTVTYNATDVAGNSATPVTRDVTVTTEVIIPTNLAFTDNSDGTFTITGNVVGTYATNLNVQLVVNGSNSGTTTTVAVDGSFSKTISLSAGTYAVTAKTINTAGEESEVAALSSALTINSTTVDNTAPTITVRNTTSGLPGTIINTASPVSIQVGDAFTFAASATDNLDGDITSAIVQTGATLDTANTGSYAIIFDVSDSAGNAANTVTLTVEVEDSTKPTLVLEDNSGVQYSDGDNITITEGDSFTLTATATDNYDTNIQSRIQTTGSLDTNTVGTYNLTFNVTDDSNNAADPISVTVTVESAAIEWEVKQLTNLGAAPTTPPVWWYDHRVDDPTTTGTGNTENSIWQGNNHGGTAYMDSAFPSPKANWPNDSGSGTSFYNPEYAKFSQSLNIGAMQVGDILTVDFIKGHNHLQRTVGAFVYMALVDFAAFESSYTNTGHADAITQLTTAADFLFKIKNKGGTSTQDAALGEFFFEGTSLSTALGGAGHTRAGRPFQLLIEKTSTNFEISLKRGDRTTGAFENLIADDPSALVQTSAITVSSLPNTLNIVIFNDRQDTSSSGNLTNIVPFANVTLGSQ